MDKFLNIIVILFFITSNSVYAEVSNRIQDGLIATENQFPFMVSLQRLSGLGDYNKGHICGGVLITLQHALTAAECTLDFHNGLGQGVPPINPDEYRVFAGSVLLTNDTSSDRIRLIANTIAHPEYNWMTSFFLNNIAVIILRTPFSVNTVTRLSIRDIGTTSIVRCTIIGWARDIQLLHGPVEAMTESECYKIKMANLPNTMCGWHEFIDNSKPPYVPCPGDEGGPLICEGDLVGIMVDRSACRAPSRLPFWIIRVSRYITWINNIVALPIPTTLPLTTLPPTTLPPTLPPTTLPPTTIPPTTLPPVTPGAGSTFQPGMAVLAVIAIAQIIAANVIN